MNGAAVEWVARQVGHKNAKMIYEVYFEWIERAVKAADREVAKLESALRKPESTGKAKRG